MLPGEEAGAAAPPAPIADDAGEPTAGAVAAGAPGAAASGGLISAARVPPKMATPPIAPSASIPIATSELVLTDTRGSIQSRPCPSPSL